MPGETHHYLGRTYPLRLVDPTSQARALRLLDGWFHLRRDHRHDAAKVFEHWYIDAGEKWLPQRVRPLADRMGVVPAPIDVRDLGYRWGSCGVRSLNFHWRTLMLPPTAIDYVIAHELAHVSEPTHSPTFWSSLRRAMPDMEKRRQ